MGKVRRQQSGFIRALGHLILYAYYLGYELTGGDLWAHDGHKDDSKHYIRLAIDLNLFKEGEYLTDTESHRPLGEYWENLGGIWGGRFANPDGNHYEWPIE